MRKWEKRALIWGVVLLTAGLAIFASLLTAHDFNLENFAAAVSDETYKTKNYKPGNDFSRIEISEISADVYILPAEDNICIVSCDETEAIGYDVQISNDTLHVSRRDAAEPMLGWLHVNMYMPAVKLYLPEGSYESLKIDCISSDIMINDLEIAKLEIAGISGDVDLCGLKLDSAELKTISGDILLLDSVAEDKISIDTKSGEVDMENCDAQLFRTLTASGDIEALLKTGKAYSVKTGSGDIYVPDDAPEGGSFHAETVSGDVRVRVK